MRRAVRVPTLSAILLAGGIASVAGCGSSDSTSPAAQFPGTYSLRTLNGQSPPFVSQDTAGTAALTSDVYTFNGDGTFTEQYSGTFTPTGGTLTPESYAENGQWTLSGTRVTVTYTSEQAQLTGAFSGGNTLTITSGSVTAVFRK